MVPGCRWHDCSRPSGASGPRFPFPFPFLERRPLSLAPSSRPRWRPTLLCPLCLLAGALCSRLPRGPFCARVPLLRPPAWAEGLPAFPGAASAACVPAAASSPLLVFLGGRGRACAVRLSVTRDFSGCGEARAWRLPSACRPRVRRTNWIRRSPGEKAAGSRCLTKLLP